MWWSFELFVNGLIYSYDMGALIGSYERAEVEIIMFNVGILAKIKLAVSFLPQ